MNIGKKEYSQIIESAGGNTKYTPDLSDESKQTIHNLIKDKEQHPEKYSKKYIKENNFSKNKDHPLSLVPNSDWNKYRP